MEEMVAVPPGVPAEPTPLLPPVSAAAALLSGLRRALRFWPVLLALWLGTLLSAFPLAFVPARSLLALADRPVLADIANGVDAWQVLDAYGLLLSGQVAAVTGGEAGPGLQIPPPLSAGLAGLTWAVVLLPLTGGAVSAFLYGGTLRTYLEADGASFHLLRFLAGCWQWFGTFLLLGFLQAILFLALLLALLLPLSLIVLGVGTNLGPYGMLLIGLLAALLLALWLAVFETARVQTAASGRRNPFRGLWQAVRLLFRRPGALLGFYALALLGLLALHALYRLLLLPLTPAGLALPALLVQQSFILLRLLARAARLAGLVEFTQG